MTHCALGYQDVMPKTVAYFTGFTPCLLLLKSYDIEGRDYNALGKIINESWMEYISCNDNGRYTIEIV